MMYDFIIVGAAQAGLSMAYELKRLGFNYLVLDKENEIGASWLNRWDSLKLFTPSEFNNLQGLDFPAPKNHYPNKYEVADYFKSYVEEFNIPVKLNSFVKSIEKKNNIYHLETEEKTYNSKNVIVATGPFHIPYTPPFHEKVDTSIKQWHSNYYKNPDQLQKGTCMVVGAGDSGFQILDEVSQTGRKTYFSGDKTVKTLPQEILGKTLWWWFTKTGYLDIHKHHWLGKYISKTKQPVIGLNTKDILNRENVVPVKKTIDAEEEKIITENKILEDVKNIIWATGYRPNFSWIKGIELDKENYPVHHRGVSNTKGLYFIGLPWLYTRGSATLGGIKKDSEYLAYHIENHSELVLS
jgi:putative flavoprotein involved in K+ transport